MTAAACPTAPSAPRSCLTRKRLVTTSYLQVPLVSFPLKIHTPESESLLFPPQTLTLISPTMYVQRDAMEADEDGEWFCPCCRHKIPMVPRDTSAHELVGLEGHSLIELASYVPYYL